MKEIFLNVPEDICRIIGGEHDSYTKTCVVEVKREWAINIPAKVDIELRDKLIEYDVLNDEGYEIVSGIVELTDDPYDAGKFRRLLDVLNGKITRARYIGEKV